MFSPLWVDPKIGPLLRRESDLRLYYGLFQSSPTDVGLLRSFLLGRSLNVEPEPENLTQPLAEKHPRSLFVFEGLKDYFSRLLGSEKFLHQELRAITQKRWLTEVDRGERFLIGINVRCGDFVDAKTPEEMYTRAGIRTPIPWFVKCLKQVREVLGFNAPAGVVSDGREHELGDLLKQENVTFIKPSNAISGILTLSRTGVFLGAGGSSFSAWATYLGGMPSITHPGKDMAWFGLKDREEQFVGVYDPSNPTTRFLDQVAKVGRRWPEKIAA